MDNEVVVDKDVIVHLVVVIPATEAGPELIVSAKVEPARGDVRDMVMRALFEYGMAHDKLPDLHCYGCECRLTFDKPIHVMAEGTAHVIATTVCDKVECSQASVKSRLCAFVNGVRERLRGGVRLCDWCFRAEIVAAPHVLTNGEPRMRPCSRCHDYYYCHRACQAKAWPAHKLVCKRPNE